MIAAAVIYGVERHFSTGGDFHAMMKFNKDNSAMWNDRMQMVAMACRNLPIPVIAMVEGACVGGSSRDARRRGMLRRDRGPVAGGRAR
jgi:enoyl-CoA hydratase/carnithine racemase